MSRSSWGLWPWCDFYVTGAVLTQELLRSALAGELLRSHADFGMAPGQVRLIKQEKVPCLADNAAALALDTEDPFKLQALYERAGRSHTGAGFEPCNDNKSLSSSSYMTTRT
eukprot:8802029-Pyramimonas_sp.AAC.2